MNKPLHSAVIVSAALCWQLADASYRESEKKVTDNGRLGAALTFEVKAAHGDLIVIFDTGKDGWPGGAAYLVRSTDGGKTWSPSRSLGLQDRNAVMQLSPSGIPLILRSPFKQGQSRPGYIFYSTDRGETRHEGVRRMEPSPFKFPMAYGVRAANVRKWRMAVTFHGYDLARPETDGSPWTTTTSHLAANIVEEIS